MLDGSQYFVLLIITDGVISDMAQTKEAIVNVSPAAGGGTGLARGGSVGCCWGPSPWRGGPNPPGLEVPLMGCGETCGVNNHQGTPRWGQQPPRYPKVGTTTTKGYPKVGTTTSRVRGVPQDVGVLEQAGGAMGAPRGSVPPQCRSAVLSGVLRVPRSAGCPSQPWVQDARGDPEDRVPSRGACCVPGCWMPVTASVTLGMGCPPRHLVRGAHHDPKDRVTIVVLGMGCPSQPQGQGAHHGPGHRMTTVTLRTGSPLWSRARSAHHSPKDRVTIMTLGTGFPSRSGVQGTHHDPKDRVPIVVLGMGCPSQSKGQGAHHGPGHRVSIMTPRTGSPS